MEGLGNSKQTSYSVKRDCEEGQMNKFNVSEKFLSNRLLARWWFRKVSVDTIDKFVHLVKQTEPCIGPIKDKVMCCHKEARLFLLEVFFLFEV